jgi:hypothetical protein
MANNPKKVKDPTEVALSAIQEALNISDSGVDPGRGPVRDDPAPPIPPVTPAYGETPFDTRASSDRPIFDPIEEPRPARRAANDDRETIGQILQAIQKGRPARNVYTLATLFAGVWVVGCGLLTVSFLPALQASIGQGSGGVLVLAGLAALFFAPVLLFYFLASLAWRGQELRMIAQSMAQVAIRFSEPEGAASDLNAPTPTTRCGSARCCRISPISATIWSGRPNRSAAPSPACRSTCATTSR